MTLPVSRHLACAARTSALATAQARAIASLLARCGIQTEIVGVTTTGDRRSHAAVHALGETNVFVKELETALRERRADYAVHSCKDLPSDLAADMRIAAISARDDARDAFCGEKFESFASLPAGAVVGTSSPRRKTQLAHLRSDLRFEDLRGNVDTRLRKLREGSYDAIVLAMAGLGRLHAAARYVVPFSSEEMVPATGQGALAIEVRAEDATLTSILRAAINDDVAERCVTVERAALRALHAGCSAPIGIYARETDGRTIVDAALAVDGRIVRERLEAPIGNLSDAQALGERIAWQVAALR